MKTDLYTKAVLSVIAVSLCVIAFRDGQIVPFATAANGPAATKYALVPVNQSGIIDVNIKSTSYPVDIRLKDIDTYDKLGVSIKEVDSYAFSNATVPVKVK